MRRIAPVLLALLLRSPELPARTASPVERASQLVRAERFAEAPRLLEPHARAHPEHRESREAPRRLGG